MDYNYLKKSIEEHKFESKEKLIEYLNSFESDNNEELEKFKYEMLKYFDETNKKELIKPDNLKELNVENDKYIKYKDSNDNTVILENNISDRPFIDQYNSIQNDLISKDKTSNLKDSHEIENQMQKTKIEVPLENENDVDETKLSNEEKNQLNAIKSTNDFQKSNYVFDTKRNLYVNKENDEAYKAEKNKEGNYEVKTAEYNNNNENVKEVSQEDMMQKMSSEQPALNINSDSSTSNNVDTINQQPNNENKIDFSGLSDTDLQFLATSGRLTDEQLVQVNNEMMIREQQKPNEYSYSKAKVLVKKYNGFSSLLILSLITGIGGMSIFLYILMMIG